MLALWRLSCLTLVGVVAAAGDRPVEASYGPSNYRYEAPPSSHQRDGVARLPTETPDMYLHQQPAVQGAWAPRYETTLPSAYHPDALNPADSQFPAQQVVAPPSHLRSFGDYTEPGRQGAGQRRYTSESEGVRTDRRVRRDNRTPASVDPDDTLSQIPARLKALNLEDERPRVPTRGLKTMLAATTLHGLSVISLPVALGLLGIGAYRFLNSKKEQKARRFNGGGFLRSKQQ